MKDEYLQNMIPDSLSGLVFGFEGIRNAVVLLNGPTGCKFYHSATADNQMLRQMAFDPHNYPVLWYFGQPRVPCTWLDKSDYVFGSEEKIKEAIAFLRETTPFDLLVIINSPGAALIGDDLRRIVNEAVSDLGMASSEAQVITIESPGYSRTIYEGYQRACQAAIEALGGDNRDPSAGASENAAAPDQSVRPVRPKVNLLGLSIFHKYYQGDRQEYERLLSLCGIDVQTSLCCECEIEEIRRITEADLNVVVDPDYGLETARYLEKNFGMPYVCPDGLPIGFEETERFFTRICETLGCDVAPLIEDSERARARSFLYISRINSLTGQPKGVRFAVHGSPAQKLGYSRFLTDYFGMSEDAGDIWETDAKLVFADGNIIGGLKARGHLFTGIETGMPSLGYIDVIPKTHLGVNGALLICEQVLNGMV